MDDSNIKRMKDILKDDSKIRKLLPYDIKDPWYTRDFETAYQDITKGINNLLENLK